MRGLEAHRVQVLESGAFSSVGQAFSLPVRRASAATCAVLALLLSGWADRAGAQTKLDARYTVALAGVTIGRGAWIVDIADNHYTAAASGRVSGLLRVLTNGEGAAAARGLIAGVRFIPATYAANINSEGKTDEVRMSLKDGTVQELAIEPVLPPHPERVPITDAHKRGVLDPLSGGLVLMAGQGDVLTPEACNRTMPVFDGRQRYDLVFSFKRMDRVKAEKGYQGPVVVCQVLYQPRAGHRPNRSAIKFLSQSREIEVWYAPVAGTRALAPFRIGIPTFVGVAVLQATHFVSAPPMQRADPARVNVR